MEQNLAIHDDQYLRFTGIWNDLPTVVSGNFHRGTPGRALAIFAACLAGIVALSIHKWWERSDFEEVRFPTGLGDKLYYQPADEDFEGTRLSIRQPDGTRVSLYRHNFEPVKKRDERMLKLVYLGTEDIWLYSDSRQTPREQESRFFLKTAPEQYIEFGKSPRQGNAPATAPADPTPETSSPTTG